MDNWRWRDANGAKKAQYVFTAIFAVAIIVGVVAYNLYT